MTTIQEYKELQAVPFSASGNYDRDAFGGLYRKIALKIDGTSSSTSATAGAGKGDAPFRLFGPKIQIQQDGEDLINTSPITLRHLAARLEGGYQKIHSIQPDTGDNNKPVLAQLPLNLRKLVPQAGIDARVKPATVLGTFGALTDYGDDGNLAVSANLRVLPEEIPSDQPSHIWQPNWIDIEREIFPAGTELPINVMRFSRPQVLPCIGFRVLDASADDRVDGLLRRLSIRLTRKGTAGRDLFRGRWGLMRSTDCDATPGFGEDDYDASVGFALFRLFDPTTPETGFAPIMNVGDTIEVVYDSSTTVEGEFTSVTPAAGDKVVLTKFAFDRYNTATGEIITAQDQVQLGFPRRASASRRTRLA